MLKNILRYGYTPTQIVSFLGRKYPDLKPFIEQASSYGYDAANILQFIQTKGPQITGYDYKENPVSDAPLVARYDHMRNRNVSGMKKLAKFLGASAALGTGLYAGLGGLASLGAAYDFGGFGKKEPDTPPNAPIPGATPFQPIEQEIVPEAETLQEMQQQESPDVLSQLGLSEQAQNMLQAGNAPELVAGYMQSYEMKTPEAKEMKRKYGDDLRRILTENATKLKEKITPQQAPVEPSISAVPGISSASPEVPIEQPALEEEKPLPAAEAKKSFTKGDIVSTKNGDTGRVISSRQNKSIVEIDGKRKSLNNADLNKVEEQPAEIDVQLSEGFTPPSRKLKSAVVGGMTYNADTKELVVKFNNGSVYLYEDVPMESYKQFSEGADACSTSGSNEFGCWWAGKSPTLGGSFVRRIKNAGFKYTRLK